MENRTHGIYLAGSTSTPLVVPTLVLGYDMARVSRSRTFSTDAGTRVSPRPASLRRGRLEFLFAGVTAAVDSNTLEESIAQGVVHCIYVLPTGGSSTFSVEGIFWALADGGEVRRTLLAKDEAWTVALDAQEVDFS